MKDLSHAVVWIDHAAARVTRFDRENSESLVVKPEGGTPHLHHKANSIDSGHLPEDEHYLHAVGKALAGASAVLVVGPSTAKTALMAHLKRHDPALARLVVDVEPMDHPTPGQLLDHARRYFRRMGHTLSQRAEES